MQPPCRFINALTDVVLIAVVTKDKRSKAAVSSCVLTLPPGCTVDATWEMFASPGPYAIADLPQAGGLRRGDGVAAFGGCPVQLALVPAWPPGRCYRALACAAADAVGASWSEAVRLIQGGQIVSIPLPTDGAGGSGGGGGGDGARMLPAAVQLSMWAATAVVVVRASGSPPAHVPRPAPRARLSARLRRVSLSVFDYERGVGDPTELDGRCAAHGWMRPGVIVFASATLFVLVCLCVCVWGGRRRLCA